MIAYIAGMTGPPGGQNHDVQRNVEEPVIVRR